MGTFQDRTLRWALKEARRGRINVFSRWMQEVVPFNRPHRLKILQLGEGSCTVELPKRRRNLNHLGTMHACAMATAAEYASGLCLLSTFGMEDVRLIMSHMDVAYTRRAQSSCTAQAHCSEENQEALRKLLKKEGRAPLKLTSVVCDAEGHEVARAEIEWHLKGLGPTKR